MPTEPVTGLALSGGGARSSFQIGALRYLYDEVGISPTVITGTSAGSILAAVLAQEGDHEGQRARLDQLETLWREMRESADMFTELPWFARLRARGPIWMEALERRQRRQGTLGRSFQRVADLRHGITAATERIPERLAAARAGQDEAAEPTPHAGAAAEPTTPQVPTAPATDTGEDGGPPAAGKRAATTEDGEDRASGQRPDSPWMPAKVLESIEMMRTVGKASADLQAIVAGAQQERSMFRPGPLVDRLVDPDVFDPDRVARSGVQLRIAVVALESGALRYVTEDGTLVDREDRPVEEGDPVDLVQAVRASCAIPMVFPPVRLGEENYVDGGVRESLPTGIALAHLGVDTCYAVVAGPSESLPRETSYDEKDMFSILLRTTTAIMTDEVQRDEVVHARAAGAVVIEPEFDVHDTMTIVPGLVAIAMDYGYLRAAEAHQGATAEEQAVTRELIRLRRRIWRAEEEAFAPGAANGEELLERVTRITGLKFELRDLLRRVPVDRLPPGAADWWRHWESHTFDIPVRSSWAGE